MGYVLGIDTSNYTTSAAAAATESSTVLQRKRLLPVREGALGLRQSDALFHHTRQLGEMVSAVCGELDGPVEAVCVSEKPRDAEGSYMPCFLAGKMAAECVASALHVPLYRTTHQAGHVAAALYSAGKLELLEQEFLAFHVSGGTFEALKISPDPEKILRAEILAHTLDISPGQLIDRTGQILGLPFPAGPALEQLALRGTCSKTRKPVLKDGCCCLSGMENVMQKMAAEEPPENVCRYLLEYLARLLSEMTGYAMEKAGRLPILYSGGVMSNSILKERLAGENRWFAEPVYSADNACGVAVLGKLFLKREGGRCSRSS